MQRRRRSQNQFRAPGDFAGVVSQPVSRGASTDPTAVTLPFSKDPIQGLDMQSLKIQMILLLGSNAGVLVPAWFCSNISLTGCSPCSMFLQEGSPGKELPHKQSPLGGKEAGIHEQSEAQSKIKEGLQPCLKITFYWWECFTPRKMHHCWKEMFLIQSHFPDRVNEGKKSPSGIRLSCAFQIIYIFFFFIDFFLFCFSGSVLRIASFQICNKNAAQQKCVFTRRCRGLKI